MAGAALELEIAHCVARQCRVAKIVPAILASLVLVSLLRKAETPGARPAYILGANLSDFMDEGFVAISALLGGLGTFFSGSTIVSNLTFGLVQLVRTCTLADAEIAGQWQRSTGLGKVRQKACKPEHYRIVCVS
jgi:L-lactate permease